MIYEIQVQYTTIDPKSGNDKIAREKYLVENVETFAEAEAKGYEWCDGETNLDVIAVKRSKVKEIINTRQSNEDLIWIAEMQDVFTTDDGDEKYIKYKVILFAKTIASAHAIMENYIKQGYNMELIGVKLTGFENLLK